MIELSILQEQLVDEYLRCERNLAVQLDNLNSNYIKGYLSRKIINGKEYYYLQYREEDKIISKYIPFEHVEIIKNRLEEQKRWKKSIRNLQADMKAILKIVKKEAIDERR